MEILTKRPERMSFQEYKEHLREQSKWIKNRLNGFLCYKASEMIGFDAASGQYKAIRRYAPFVGDASKLKPL